ncbi:hypothetical protein BsWGS_23249 [Bradybaena similaris]
MKSCQGPKVVV